MENTRFKLMDYGPVSAYEWSTLGIGLDAAFKFCGTKAVFVRIVRIDAFGAEGCITVAFPAAAQVQLVENTAYAPLSGYSDAGGIVFAVTHVGESDFPDCGSEEGAGSAKTVYAQGVVRAVFIGPFAVVDDAGRQGLETEVAHAVTANYHGIASLFEFVNYFLQGGGAAVKIVAVQLYGKAAAALIAYGKVPAAAYAKVGAGGDNVNQAFIGGGKLLKYPAGAVSGMVVNYNDVEAESGLLLKCGFDGIGYGAGAVAYRYDDRCGNRETALGDIGHASASGLQVCADAFQMLGADGLHVNLHTAVARVDVVELLLSRCAQIGLGDGVERLVQADNGPMPLYGQAQLVEAGILSVNEAFLGQVAVNTGAGKQDNRAEIEVIADGTCLKVDDWGWDYGIGSHLLQIVAVYHACARACRKGGHATGRFLRYRDLTAACVKQNVLSFNGLQYAADVSP